VEIFMTQAFRWIHLPDELKQPFEAKAEVAMKQLETDTLSLSSTQDRSKVTKLLSMLAGEFSKNNVRQAVLKSLDQPLSSHVAVKFPTEQAELNKLPIKIIAIPDAVLVRI